MFIEIGRFACEEHYRVGRPTVNTWLNSRGKLRLIQLRTLRVKELRQARLRRCPPDFRVAYVYLGWKGCQQRYRTGRNAINRWLDECGREALLQKRADYLNPPARLTAQDLGPALARAFPVNAANLRIVPNTDLD